jgi:hypothetical protein
MITPLISSNSSYIVLPLSQFAIYGLVLGSSITSVRILRHLFAAPGYHFQYISEG